MKLFGDKIDSAFLHYSTNGLANLMLILTTDFLNMPTIPPLMTLTPLLVYIYRREVLEINTDMITEMFIGYFSLVVPYILIWPGLYYGSEKGWKNAFKKKYN